MIYACSACFVEWAAETKGPCWFCGRLESVMKPDRMISPLAALAAAQAAAARLAEREV